VRAQLVVGPAPPAANSRASGAFSLCPVACHLVAL
jgi:hypothetical protein